MTMCRFDFCMVSCADGGQTWGALCTTSIYCEEDEGSDQCSHIVCCPNRARSQRTSTSPPCRRFQFGCEDESYVSLEQHFRAGCCFSEASTHTQWPIDSTLTTALQAVAQSPACLSDNEEMITVSLTTC